MVPPGLEEEVALPEAVVAELEGDVLVAEVEVGGVAAELPVEAAAGLEEQSEAAAEPSVEVAAPVGAEEVDVLEVPGVGE